MPGLTFNVTAAEAIPYAAAPTIAFALRATSDMQIHSIALRAQILIEAGRRHYDARERAGLRDLFGEPDRWSRTLRSLLWTHAATAIPAFFGETEVEIQVPCTFDFNVGAAKYFYGIDSGEIPLCFQFSGTVFYEEPNGAVLIEQIAWDKESRFRLPAEVWGEMMDHYYPNSAWLRLGRDAFDGLYEYKRDCGLSTWEEAITSLLNMAKESLVVSAKDSML